MATTSEVKRDRVQLRLDAKTKRNLERAAAYEHKTVTEFVLSHAAAAAERVIEANETVALSAADWDVLYDTLVNPPEPNERLKAAYRRYRARGAE